MKKISLFIILMIFLIKVNSLEYEWKDTLNNQSNNYIVESEVRYKWYKNNYIKTVYELYNNQHASSYELNNYIYSDYLITDEYPEENDFREIVSFTEEKLLDKDIFNMIILNDLEINGSFTFDGIIIYDNDKNYIDFDIKIIYESGKEIVDDSINQKYVFYGIDAYSKKIKEIIITFKESVNINNLNIHIYYRSYNEAIKKMNIYLKYKDEYYTKEKTYFMNTHSSICNNGYCELNFNIKEYLNSNYIINMYKYRDKLFKYDIYEKKYENEYYSYLENYEKDIETAKVFYRYKDQEICINNNESNNEIIGSINDVNEKKLALNTSNKKSKITYNNILIFMIFFTIISLILYLLLIVLKKLINKCRMK